MPRNSDTFWSRVLFKDFIRHFRKMTPEQIAEDIAASMDALDDLNPDGDSFGSLMVRWANDRMNGAFATAARENGRKGGRPRKNQETTADGDTREDSHDEKSGASANLSEAIAGMFPTSRNSSEQEETLENQRRTGTAVPELRRAEHSHAPVRSGRNSRRPDSREDFHAFVADNNLHEGLAEEWYAIHEARGWVDETGNPIKNWKGALYNYCTKTEQKRRTA